MTIESFPGTHNRHLAIGKNITPKIKNRTERLLGIELGRCIACIFVIIIHQNSSNYGSNPYGYEILNQVSRWAVPFFFILAGFFLPTADTWQKNARKYFLRLFPVCVFWTVAYALSTDHPIVFFGSIKSTLNTLIVGGNGYHLWFLSSLGICLLIAAIFNQFTSMIFLSSVAALMYFIGLSYDSYSELAFGIPHSQVRYDTRNGPFFGLIFVCLGILLRKKEIAANINSGLFLTCVGLMISGAEILLLYINYDFQISRHNFLLGTIPFSLGVTMIFLTTQIQGSRVSKIVKRLGAVSLGIYAVHLFLLRQITEWVQPASPISGLAVALLVFLLSAAIATAGARIPLLQRVFR